MIALKRPVLDPVSSAGLERTRASTRTLAPTAPARLLARLRAGRLDRALIEGADPAGSSVLAARAAVLTSERNRAALADGLRRLSAASRGPRSRWWALGWTAAVEANSADLLGLARLLESGTPLYARGLAAVSELLSDGTGPAYSGNASALARAVSDAREALRS